MWPWEHAALGYLLYSLGRRALKRDPPSDVGAAVLLVGTQLPDLVDKPLSWGLGLFPTGYALGHSVFIAVPVGVVLVAAGVRISRRRYRIAFVAGYWSHLLADVLDPLRNGAPVAPSRVLWPVVTQPPYEQDLGLGRGLTYLGDFLGALQSMDPGTLIVVYLLLPVGTIALWISDGTPGLALIRRTFRAIRETTR